MLSPSDAHLRRRSKSLDDLSLTANQNVPSHTGHSHHCDFPLSTSSNAAWPTPLPRRRHSACIKSHAKQGSGGLTAVVYDWVTVTAGNRLKSVPKYMSRTPPSLLHKRSLPSSRSFSRSVTPHTLTRVLCRRKSLTTPHSASSPMPVSAKHRENAFYTKGIVSAIIAAARRPESEPLGWVGVEQPDPQETGCLSTMSNSTLSSNIGPPSLSATITTVGTDTVTMSPSPTHRPDSIASTSAPSSRSTAPSPPLENYPIVYDILRHDSSQFIRYSHRGSHVVISSATMEKLVEILTREMDSEFLLDFFLVYRHFVTPIKLCKLLILRFRWALLADSDEHRLVRIRTFVVIRHWLTHYWSHDFMASRTLRFMLCAFLSQLRTHPVILASPRDERIIKTLRTVFKRQRKLFNDDNISSKSTVATVRSSLWSFRPADVAYSIRHLDGFRTLPRLYPRNSRKDSGIGIAHSISKDGRTKTPSLSFLPRSRGTPTPKTYDPPHWTARINLSLRGLKRSMPSMYQSVRHAPLSSTLTDINRLSRCVCQTSLTQHGTTSPVSHTHDWGRVVPSASQSTPTPVSNSPGPAHFRSSACPVHASPSAGRTPSSETLRNGSLRSALYPDALQTDDMYRSIILRYRSEVIAQQFCVIEQQMLQNVTWDELSELRWRHHRKTDSIDTRRTSLSSTSSSQGGVEKLIGFFNQTCQWIASEIVRTTFIDTRVKIVEKLIRIALKCYHHRNYSTLMQILLGLQSPAVSRLERTWQRVDHYEMHIFTELREMAKPFHNWKNVRECMSKASEDVSESSAVENILTHSKMPPDLVHVRGSIPFLGLYLSDLVFIAELPTHVDATHGDSESVDQIDPHSLRSRLSTQLVNYNRFRITASVIKHVLAFQVLSRAYQFTKHPELYDQLQHISYLDHGQIREASFLCEE